MTKTNEVKEVQSQSVISVVNYPSAIIGLKCEKEIITAQLDDGRTVSIPTAWFKRLRNATSEQLNNFQIAFDGEDITWPELNTDISVKSFTHGLGNSCC